MTDRPLEDSGLLAKNANKQKKKKKLKKGERGKEQNRESFWILIGTLALSLFGDLLPDKE